MVKFLKPNKVVVLLQGRFAGRKAVIVKTFDDGTLGRAYGHCIVAGIAKYPKKVIRKDSAKKTAKKSRLKCFIKLANYNHIMPTREPNLCWRKGSRQERIDGSLQNFGFEFCSFSSLRNSNFVCCETSKLFGELSRTIYLTILELIIYI
eukprot:Gb_34700 [translate_table: standard]